MLKVVMVRGRKLKTGGGDLEIHKQNVVPLKLKPKEQNVAPSKLRPKEQNVVSLEMRIENWCIKQSMSISVNKDENL